MRKTLAVFLAAALLLLALPLGVSAAETSDKVTVSSLSQMLATFTNADISEELTEVLSQYEIAENDALNWEQILVLMQYYLGGQESDYELVGYGKDSDYPNAAQVMQFAKKNVTAVYTKQNTYDQLGVKQDGIVVINGRGVTLRDAVINGVLIITRSVGNGTVNLENVKINGQLVINGGGLASVNIKGKSEIEKVVVSKRKGNVSVNSGEFAKIGEFKVINSANDIVANVKADTLNANSPKTRISLMGSASEANINEDNAVLHITKDGYVKKAIASGETTAITSSFGASDYYAIFKETFGEMGKLNLDSYKYSSQAAAKALEEADDTTAKNDNIIFDIPNELVKHQKDAGINIYSNLLFHNLVDNSKVEAFGIKEKNLFCITTLEIEKGAKNFTLSNAVVGEAVIQEGSNVSLSDNAAISFVEIPEGAKDVTVNISENSLIPIMYVAADGAIVGGAGKAFAVYITGNDVDFSCKGAAVYVDEDATGVMVDGKPVEGGKVVTSTGEGTSAELPKVTVPEIMKNKLPLQVRND